MSFGRTSGKLAVLLIASAVSISAAAQQSPPVAGRQATGSDERAAGDVTQPSPKADTTTATKLAEAAAQPTPRTQRGNPNLTGYWGPVVEIFGFDGQKFISEE